MNEETNYPNFPETLYESENKTNISLHLNSVGIDLVFKPDKELSWAEYEKYEELGGLTKAVMTKEEAVEMDLSKAGKQNREQLLFLVRFYWDAYHVDFKKLTLTEVAKLIKPVNQLNPLAEIREAMKMMKTA